jgi:hypothetical protein
MNDAKDEPQYFTARHLLQMLQGLDAALLDMPNLVAGFLPSAVPVDKEHVEEKKPSFLSLGHLTKFKRK